VDHDDAHALIEGLVRDELAWEPDAPAEEITEAVIAELRDMRSADTLSDDDIFAVLSFLALRALSTPTTPLELFFAPER
jgi:hypothetical protein